MKSPDAMNPALFSRRSFLTASGLAATAAALPGGLLSAQDAPSAKRLRIKIGQIGTGNQHASKIGTLRRLTDLFEVVGVAEDDAAQRAKALKIDCYKGLTWMTSDELLAVPGLQAVAVETEEHAPIPTALRCIRAGKHIHLDKPCGESLPQLRQLLDEAKARSLTVQVGYMYRNNPRGSIKAVKDGVTCSISTAMSRYDGPIPEAHQNLQGRDSLHSRLPSDRPRRNAHGRA
jgi:hypothetical protein